MSTETVSIRGNAVNVVRVNLGLTRQEFYRKASVHPATGSKVLSGGRVQLDIARRVAESLGMEVSAVADLSELIGDENPQAVAC